MLTFFLSHSSFVVREVPRSLALLIQGHCWDMFWYWFRCISAHYRNGRPRLAPFRVTRETANGDGESECRLGSIATEGAPSSQADATGAAQNVHFGSNFSLATGWLKENFLLDTHVQETSAQSKEKQRLSFLRWY